MRELLEGMNVVCDFVPRSWRWEKIEQAIGF